ncbi:uncharacterized protein LACBIDRAFT_325098 [Laccaria bicolor S238N-H82]|uniref:Predicted protein n=1 Tax=Laccaria bicolor (strain S238N-H82 / ATCC MYA-4686) TaxID=486041 RepID=B0D243_LACBS|nr:uncharacterized protein LACBIDRAFT_325098 [Laccaria bicolor S238N-H82]EDR11035.1 predicted protein [Laccaria bicolor S238N-H82]|eukprot:XP_001878336.1 predicted protein [Laccaria bicolor S238N-H82]
MDLYLLDTLVFNKIHSQLCMYLQMLSLHIYKVAQLLIVFVRINTTSTDNPAPEAANGVNGSVSVPLTQWISLVTKSWVAGFVPTGALRGYLDMIVILRVVDANVTHCDMASRFKFNHHQHAHFDTTMPCHATPPLQWTTPNKRRRGNYVTHMDDNDDYVVVVIDVNHRRGMPLVSVHVTTRGGTDANQKVATGGCTKDGRRRWRMDDNDNDEGVRTTTTTRAYGQRQRRGRTDDNDDVQTTTTTTYGRQRRRRRTDDDEDDVRTMTKTTYGR